MSYFLFFLYLVLICWALPKIPFLKNSGLPAGTLRILFLIKALAGVFAAWMNIYSFPLSDSLYFNEDGEKEFHLLFNNPKEYFINIFHTTHPQSLSTGFFDTNDSFWNDLRSNIISKVLSIFDIFSNCNFYINTLFFNFFVFLGLVVLYKVYLSLFPGKGALVIMSVFLLPSALFFSSMIHRDGFVLLALGVICYNLFNILKDRFTFKRAFLVLAALAFIFFLRNFVLITIIPCLIAWVIAEKRKKFELQTFVLVFVFFGILFFGSSYINNRLDFPQRVSSRQIAFIQLARSSASAININPLFPNFRSFLNNTPQALNHSLMRPYLTETNKWTYLPASLEIFLYEILFLLFLLFRVSGKRTDPFIYFSIFFALSINLQIGYTIPIIGALVRYRSIYFLFLITPLLCLTDWRKIKALLNIRK